MIELPLSKILFIDIETVGIEKDWESMEKKRPNLARLFEHYVSWIKKRYPEDAHLETSELFVSRSALLPEFGKIVSVVLGLTDKNNELRLQTFSGYDEYELLKNVRKTLIKCGELQYWLCGHNVKGFDIPYLAKRMIVNDMKPPRILPGHDTKPWEVKSLDTRELWQYGSFGSIATLDLMCGVLGIESSKSDDMDGSKVHENFWFKNDLEKIDRYCEQDVRVLYDVIKKLKELKEYV
jgi:3'-5' exonuclease